MKNSNHTLPRFKMLSKKEIVESRRLKPNEVHSLKIKGQKNQHPSLKTNTLINKINPLDTLVKDKEITKQDKKVEPTPQVSSGGLILPPKRPDQIATQFDMSKDEWTLGELLDMKITEIPFLVDKLIPLHTLNVLAGQSERGKSTLYTQLSLAIIRGDDEFLGCKLNTTHKRVLVISTEDGPVALSFRTNKQLTQASSTVELRDRLVFITNQDNLEVRIENYLKKTKVDLIVMDAFGDVFTGGDINASNSVRRFLDKYVNFIRKYGCSVLFVHHVGKGKQSNKAEKDQLLGSTGIEGKMRNVLMLSIVNDQHQLSIAKGNYINREDKKIPIYLNFNSNTLTFSKADGPAKPSESDETAITSSEAKNKPGKQKDMALYNQAIQLYKEGKPQVEIAKIVGRDKSTVSKWIKEHKSKPDLP
jgi:hypothetical protein